jgi:hypothetical protein
MLFVVYAYIIVGIAGALFGQPHLGALIGQFSGVLVTLLPGLASGSAVCTISVAAAVGSPQRCSVGRVAGLVLVLHG